MDRNSTLTELSNKFNSDQRCNIFQNFISHIRFPYFKNFEDNFRLDFNFPITFLVGGNGSGKSSLLHAMYGAPKGKSITDFWFTTKLDPIKDNRNCFIYGYTTKITKTNVEILQSRMFKEGKPDYWETARPQITFGMIAPDDTSNVMEASATRWNPVDRNVHYMDFRYSLSAYDKYFYFGSLPNSTTLKTKQDVIRKHAPKLKRGFDLGTRVEFYTRSVKKIEELTQNELSILSEILSKQYSEIKIITHDLYDKTSGFSIRYKTNSINYSEAYAGSGETAIVKLVHELYHVEKYSLILLDEPETSLHPGAQKLLINFVLQQILKKQLQVVISTHSPDIIEGMPKEAIKILYENPLTNKTKIIENVLPEYAFIKIGRKINSKTTIIVEDRLAQLVIESVLKNMDHSSLIDVKFSPGGESRIKTEDMIVHSKHSNGTDFIVFDGDQLKTKVDISDLSNNQKIEENLKIIINELTGCNSLNFASDSGRQEQQINAMLNYIKYHHDNVFFLPQNIPEEIIWNDDVLERADIEEQDKSAIKAETCLKKKFNLFAEYLYGTNDSESQNFAYNYFIVKWLKLENEDYKSIEEIILKVLSISNPS